jgi:hypothetical protein
MKFLPILVPCEEFERDGDVNGEPVRIVPYDVGRRLFWDASMFRAQYGEDIPDSEERRLRGFWLTIAAFRGRRNQEIKDTALALAKLADDPNLTSEILRDPLHFVQEQLNQRAAAASLVLWHARMRPVLNAGIFCEGGMRDALYALMLFRIGVGDSRGRMGSCVVCGTIFDNEHGNRKTCSTRCRKRMSRARAKTTSN